jgi:hypothetical protein
MLHLQRKNVLHKIAALTQLILVSGTLHVALLCVFFFLYNRDAVIMHTLRITRRLPGEDVPIFVVGYGDRLTQSLLKQRASTQRTPQKAVMKKASKVSEKIKTQAPKSSQLVTAPVAPAVSKQSKVKPAVVAQKTVPAKLATTVAPQLAETKSVELKKAVEQKKVAAPIVAPEPKVAIPEQQVAREIVSEQKAVAQEQKVVPESAKQNIVKEQDVQEEDQNSAVIVVQNYREKVALTKHYAFERLLCEAWHPPVGVRGRSCTLKINLARDGTVRGIDMVKPSGLVMYDVQARSAILTVSMPSEMWGAAVEITFEC